jgi:serine phosphatase RsbU (regulator of sigma subunit)
VVEVHHDDLLVLYTDGLVERRGEHLDKGIDRLASYLAATRDASLESMLAEIVQELVGDAPEDDVAIVAARLDAARAGA